MNRKSSLSDPFESDLSARLEELERAGLRRRPRVVDPRTDGVVLCSNDYLGLKLDPRIARAASSAALRDGAGSGASRLISGTTPRHVALESALARWAGCQSALVFNSGFQANLGVLSALMGKDDIVFSDALNHASLIDGLRLSRAKRVIYPHADLDSSAGCFSMSGGERGGARGSSPTLSSAWTVMLRR